ncbi:MAG: class I SAM-dependent methyltransferase [Desulfobulbaceae bacterium]|nr:class I SAM-dependent methyltransferase [Desulfobulbaceae bacterium]
MNNQWKVWDDDKGYGEVLFKRAIGDLPEMESSKKIALVLKKYFEVNNHILDVGCGAGHYLKSLRKEFGANFSYLGVDATQNYIDLAKKAFQDDDLCDFKVSDIFNLELQDSSYDLVMCNNVFLHLPSIKKPLTELVRVARGQVVVRLLAGSRSFQIKDVAPQENGLDFTDKGDPVSWHYYNIYSKNYINALLLSNKKVKKWKITADFDYKEKNIMNSIKDHGDVHDASTMLGDYQVNGYIIQPWSILEIEIDNTKI